VPHISERKQSPGARTGGQEARLSRLSRLTIGLGRRSPRVDHACPCRSESAPDAGVHPLLSHRLPTLHGPRPASACTEILAPSTSRGAWRVTLCFLFCLSDLSSLATARLLLFRNLQLAETKALQILETRSGDGGVARRTTGISSRRERCTSVAFALLDGRPAARVGREVSQRRESSLAGRTTE